MCVTSNLVYMVNLLNQLFLCHLSCLNDHHPELGASKGSRCYCNNEKEKEEHNTPEVLTCNSTTRYVLFYRRSGIQRAKDEVIFGSSSRSPESDCHLLGEIQAPRRSFLDCVQRVCGVLPGECIGWEWSRQGVGWKMASELTFNFSTHTSPTATPQK